MRLRIQPDGEIAIETDDGRFMCSSCDQVYDTMEESRECCPDEGGDES